MARHITNPLQEVVDSVVKDYKKAKRSADDSNIIPFGQEQVTRKQLRVRFQEADQEERKKIREMIGTDEILKALGG